MFDDMLNYFSINGSWLFDTDFNMQISALQGFY